MKVLYIDAFSGISGDMSVGALLALGLPLERLKDQLGRLGLSGYTVSADPCQVHGIRATKFTVRLSTHSHPHRPFRDIRGLLDASTLEPAVKRTALAIFTCLAEAEGHVHGFLADDVEFHEVGAIDSIVDVVGTAVGIAWLGIESTYVSALPLGSGLVRSAHGTLPVPAPATVELLRGFATRPGDGEGELVTPTGAAVVAALASTETLPALRIRAVGYGAGERTLKDRPNLLRLVLGERVAATGHDTLTMIETNIDDFNPELYEHVMDQLFRAGARDVYLTPVQMKKNRPGIVLSVLSPDSNREDLSAVILSETSAVGVRYYPVRRHILARESRTVTTSYGPIRVKVALTPDGRENLAPEYEDCKRTAQAQNVPIKLVYQAALAAAADPSTRNK
ncbi:MAG: nickel pincer cofactor biosynthesis protein LarC [Candidatus Binatia bacterium]